MAALVRPLTGKAKRAYLLARGPKMSDPRRTLIMKGPGGDCHRPGLWPTTEWVADMTDRTCTEPGCPNPPRGRQLLCSKHYQQQWRQARPCGWEGCDKPVVAKGLCNVHYRRQRTGMPMDVEDYYRHAGTECSVPDCCRPHHAVGLCSMHNARRRRTGDPTRTTRIVTAECTVAGCAAPHMAHGLCHRHYEIRRRHGAAEPEYACRACGGPFEPSSGEPGRSYVYCPPCAAEAPKAYFARATRLRVQRLRANNAGMTSADEQESAAYRAIILRDPCVYCGEPSAVVDHIAPVVAGGGDWWTNLAPACRGCNAVKHDRSLLIALLALSERRSP